MQYYYCACLSCQKRQYLGAELQEAPELVSALLMDSSPANALALRGIASSLLLAMKFIRRHQGHQLTLWSPGMANAAPAAFAEEWPYDRDLRDFEAPSFSEVEPLPAPDVESDLRRSVAEWKTKTLHMELELRRLQTLFYKDDDAKVKEIRARVRKLAAERGADMVGYHAPGDEHPGVVPPPEEVDPLRAQIRERIDIAISETE